MATKKVVTNVIGNLSEDDNNTLIAGVVQYILDHCGGVIQIPMDQLQITLRKGVLFQCAHMGDGVLRIISQRPNETAPVLDPGKTQANVN